MENRRPRVNFQLPAEVEDYIERRMKQTGLTKAAMLVMAMQEWYDAKMNLEKMENLPELIAELKKLQENMK